MNRKSVLAIVATGLAGLSVAWAASAPQTIHGPIDGTTFNFPCGVSFLLFGGAVPPNGFMVQPVGFGGVVVINDNGPAGFDFTHNLPTGGFYLQSSSNNPPVSLIFVTGPGYKPMGPVSLFTTTCSPPGGYIAARAW
jgi:hypothetical protein